MNAPERAQGIANAAAVELMTKEEYVSRRLREMVISGELAPGTRLRQQQLAADFGVSPTPVREALRRLLTEGFLEAQPHVGMAVAHPVAEWTLEVFEIRQSLEGRLVAAASRKMTAARIEVLRRLNVELRDAAARQDFVAARLLNYRFHYVIWEDANLPVTLGIVKGLWSKFPLDNIGNVTGRAERSFEEHEKLIEFIERREPREAKRMAYIHIRGGREDYVRLMDTRKRR